MMRNLYRHSENAFERIATVAIAILGNSITFIIACCVVMFWLGSKQFYMQDLHDIIGDLILAVAYLSLFIIQKSFNRFSASLHLKVNELLASHLAAKNSVINAEGKTESEIIELAKEYTELSSQANEVRE
jgi:low affinity Fe/Cu permease